MAKKKTSIRSVILLLCITLLILLGVAEFGTRFFLAREIKKEFVSTIQEQGVEHPESPEVGFGFPPVLLGLATGSLSEVNLEAPASLNESPNDENSESTPPSSSLLSGQPALTVHAQGVTVDPQNPVVDLLHLKAEVPTDMILAEVRKALHSSTENNGRADSLFSDFTTITNLTANEQDQTLEFEMGTGIATVAMSPTIKDGVLSFTPAHASVMGVKVGDSIVANMRDALTQVIDQVAGLTFQFARITEQGLEVEMQGTDISLRDLDSVASVGVPA